MKGCLEALGPKNQELISQIMLFVKSSDVHHDSPHISSISNRVCSSPPWTCSRASTKLVLSLCIIGCLEHLKSAGWFGVRKNFRRATIFFTLPSLAKFSWKNGSPKRLPKVSQILQDLYRAPQKNVLGVPLISVPCLCDEVL